MLTGKAKEEFYDWIVDKYFFKGKNYSDLNIYQKGDLAQFLRFPTIETAYIIEWFDSVGIFVTIEYNDVAYKFQWNLGFYPRKEDIFSKAIYKNRSESSLSAVKKANEIYNTK